MKKKIFTFFILALAVLTLAACGKEYKVEFDSDGGSAVTSQTVKAKECATEPAAPTKSGYKFVEWQLDGTKYDFSSKVTKDITLKAVWRTLENFTVTFDSDGGEEVVSQTVVEGGVVVKPADPYKEGSFFAEWQFNGVKYDFATPVTANLTLKAVWNSIPLAGGEEGKLYNYKYAEPEVRAELAATLERWLINHGVSIPVFYQNSFTLYASRVQLPVEEYVPLMGFGASYGTFTTGTCSGTEEDPAYRTYTTASPVTLYHSQYKDSAESDVLDLVEASLFGIYWNQNFDGYVMAPDLAASLAYPVTQDADGNWVKVEDPDVLSETKSKIWKVEIRDDIKWSDGSAITLNDFMTNYRYLLDPKLKNSRANSFWAQALKLVNAQNYYEGNAKWEEVGIVADEETNSIVFKLISELTSWDFHYNMASFILGPVKADLFESLLSKDGTEAGYGKLDTSKTTVDSMLFSGQYMIEYYEKDKETRYVANPYWKKNPEVPHAMTPEKLTSVIVKDSNAAFELWQQGKLDVIGIPTAKYDEYKNNPSIKSAPDSTVWRFSINQMSQEQLDAEFGKGAWEAKPIMANKNFHWALYYGMNRTKIATDVLKTSSPAQFYLNNAYLINGASGTGYRASDWAKKVASGIFHGDLDLLEDTYGYSPEDAVDFYIAALKDLQKEGKLTNLITVEIASFDGSSHEDMLTAIKDDFEVLFNSEKVKAAFPNVRFEMTTSPQPGMDIYYQKQMKGKYDLGIAGISGSVMDVISLFDVFSSNKNTNTLRLSLGVDTTDVANNPVLFEGMYWAYDALVAAANGPTWIVNGNQNSDLGNAQVLANAQVNFWTKYALDNLENAEAEVAKLKAAAQDEVASAVSPAAVDSATQDYISELVKLIAATGKTEAEVRSAAVAAAKDFALATLTEGVEAEFNGSYVFWAGVYQCAIDNYDETKEDSTCPHDPAHEDKASDIGGLEACQEYLANAKAEKAAFDAAYVAIKETVNNATNVDDILSAYSAFEAEWLARAGAL